MLAQIQSGTVLGYDAVPIDVEVDVAARGLPSLSIVGLPDKAVQESKERVRTALENNDIEFPPRRITINLAPADIPKVGPAFDLPIAVGIMLAKKDVVFDTSSKLFIGEMSLDGTLRHTAGIVAIVSMAKKWDISQVFVPYSNRYEASLIKGVSVFPVKTIKQLLAHILGFEMMAPANIHPKDVLNGIHVDIDMADITGQAVAKRGLEIAAAGGHNVFLSGLPGAGKTMLAKAFPGLLPPLTPKEIIEVTRVYSIAGLLKPGNHLVERPYRHPHHTASRVGLVGGGTSIKPGEISLAHRGVLFMDEFPEFPRSILESLRQPLEDGTIQISRAAHSSTFPARFLLIAASNPCPCGHFGDPKKSCSCTANEITRYQKRISGPILDRFDIHLNIPSVPIEDLIKASSDQESTLDIRNRVIKAREFQINRFNRLNINTNSEMTTAMIKKQCPLSSEAQSFMLNASQKLNVSARGYYKTIKVARTIADLSESQEIEIPFLAEALQYRHRLPVVI